MQLWEAERYDWALLKTASKSAIGVPVALERLRTATSSEDADDAYWRIDNHVVVQGALYEAALPTAACIVTMLSICTPVSRVRMLELLDQISGGEPPDGDDKLVSLIGIEVIRGFGIYAALLQQGADMERELCIDLVLSCARDDASLRSRARFYLQKLTDDVTTIHRVREYAQRRLIHEEAGWLPVNSTGIDEPA